MSAQLDRMIAQFPQAGQVEWLGVRLARKAEMVASQSVIITASGLEGDHRAAPGKRAVTLIQAEHLPMLAAFTGMENVSPSLLRRNIVISGINLLALRKIEFQVGGATLKGTGPCAPCSRMEQALGKGGFNAMRGHGGITAEVVAEGAVRIGDSVLV
ncbi:MAG: MOSC domain-containing protein [Pseudomonadota bacterium]